MDEGGKLKMVDVNIGFKIKSMSTELNNLFDGNQVLSEYYSFIGEFYYDQCRCRCYLGTQMGQ